MKPEAQRIAIAEACGWTYVHLLLFTGYKNGKPLGNHEVLPPQSPLSPRCGTQKIPDYLVDLNAMHEAEMTLTKNQRNTYVNLLDGLVEDDEQPDKDFAWCCANAAQRAEAFLRTLGKWEES